MVFAFSKNNKSFLAILSAIFFLIATIISFKSIVWSDIFYFFKHLPPQGLDDYNIFHYIGKLQSFIDTIINIAFAVMLIFRKSIGLCVLSLFKIFTCLLFLYKFHNLLNSCFIGYFPLFAYILTFVIVLINTLFFKNRKNNFTKYIFFLPSSLLTWYYLKFVIFHIENGGYLELNSLIYSLFHSYFLLTLVIDITPILFLCAYISFQKPQNSK